MDVYRLSRAVQRAIQAAAAEARALGHGRLDAAHLLLGLLVEPGAASVALSRAGVGADALRRKVDEGYDGIRDPRAKEIDRSGGEIREVLAGARDEADASGEHDIALVRLFLAATEDEEGSACRALRALGVDVDKVRADAEGLARDEAQGSLPE